MARQKGNNKQTGKKRGRGGSGQNRAESEKFFAKNRQKPGVIETASGLQYIAEQEGDGPKPGPNSTIVVNQRIMLVDGTVIKDTYHTGLKDEFSMTEAIEGLKEGIQLMSVGSKYKFFVPSDLAWGKRGAGAKIGPNAALIFDIRLEDCW